MADQTNNSTSNGLGAFVLGGVVVALGVLAWVVFGGGISTDQPDVTIEIPGVGAVEGEVTSN